MDMVTAWIAVVSAHVRQAEPVKFKSACDRSPLSEPCSASLCAACGIHSVFSSENVNLYSKLLYSVIEMCDKLHRLWYSSVHLCAESLSVS